MQCKANRHRRRACHPDTLPAADVVDKSCGACVTTQTQKADVTDVPRLTSPSAQPARSIKCATTRSSATTLLLHRRNTNVGVRPTTRVAPRILSGRRHDNIARTRGLHHHQQRQKQLRLPSNGRQLSHLRLRPRVTGVQPTLDKKNWNSLINPIPPPLSGSTLLSQHQGMLWPTFDEYTLRMPSPRNLG